MERTEDRITKKEVIALYLFVAVLIAATIACSWVIYSSWHWVVP